ncbi:hypothetical protein E2542_SST19406 [Spatholobus suberectus]|nr:hypothetical protein E2542_SST19406 [Spatholobus suberectus]
MKRVDDGADCVGLHQNSVTVEGGELRAKWFKGMGKCIILRQAIVTGYADVAHIVCQNRSWKDGLRLETTGPWRGLLMWQSSVDCDCTHVRASELGTWLFVVLLSSRHCVVIGAPIQP